MIRNLHDRGVLIATHTAYRPLLDAGLLPDVVVAIDPDTPTLHSAASPPVTDPPLVYFPAVPTEALSEWNGPRLAAYPSRPDHPFRTLQTQYPKGTLFSAGSDLHVAIDLAVKMGADRTLLVGADFTAHAGASATQPPSNSDGAGVTTPWVLNGHGARIATSRTLQGALRDLERYVHDHPEVGFINASREGALIQGTTYIDEVAA